MLFTQERSHLICISLLLGTLLLAILTKRANAQDNTICGYLQVDERSPIPSLEFTPYGTTQPVPTFFDNNAFGTLPAWVEFTGIHINRSGVLVSYDSYRVVSSCAQNVPSVPSIPKLVISNLEILPGEASVYQAVRLKITVENQGAPLTTTIWNYSGTVNLEDVNGTIVDTHSFTKGDASYISPVVEGGRVNLQKWLITINMRFGSPVTAGRLEVILQPDKLPSLETVGAITIHSSILVVTCTSVVINKLAGPFLSEVGQAAGETITVSLKESGCQEGDLACQIPPLVKGLLKIIGRNASIGKIIVGIWGVFDTDALEVCRDPVNLMWQLIREFNRQGVPINAQAIHSPMLIWITNAIGQRAGFISEDQSVVEIPDARAIEWIGDKYIIYPADANVVVTLIGIGEGNATFDSIGGPSDSEISFSNIHVSDGSRAQITLSDQQPILYLDYNGDGIIDETRLADRVESLAQPLLPTPSSAITTTPELQQNTPTTSPTTTPTITPSVATTAPTIMPSLIPCIGFALILVGSLIFILRRSKFGDRK